MQYELAAYSEENIIFSSSRIVGFFFFMQGFQYGT